MTKACAQCGTLFRVFPSQIKTRRFCRPACAYASFHQNGWAKAKPKISIACETCGARRIVNPYRAGRTKFCTQRCMIIARSAAVPPAKKIDRECQECGKRFKRSPHAVRIGRGKFCSRHCVGIHTARCGTRISGPERRFLDALEAEGVLVLRSYSALGFVMDGYVPAWNLMIEVDGEYWHSLPDMVKRDVAKDAALVAAGYGIHRVRVGRVEPDYLALARELKERAHAA